MNLGLWLNQDAKWKKKKKNGNNNEIFDRVSALLEICTDWKKKKKKKSKTYTCYRLIGQL